MPYANNTGVRIHYEVDGPGPALVLHHGFTQCLEDWSECGYVAALRPGYQVILVDARGHGGSDKPHDEASYRLDCRAADVTTVLDALGVEKAHFWGYSMGGRIGFGMARYAPDRVDRLVIASNIPFASDMGGIRQMIREGITGGRDALVAGFEKRFGPIADAHATREAEMAFLRQQLLVLKRSTSARLRLRKADRLIFVWLYRLFPSLLGATVIFQPDTLVRWHRNGFRLYWCWKSRRRRVGRPAVPADIRDLVRTMSRDNPLWGAPRIHGELLKLGINIAQSTVAKYMPRRRGPPSPGWRAFLRNHTAHIAAIDLFVVSTMGFKLLYGLVILRLDRRRLVWTNVTANPTADWIARLRAMGIRDRPITPRSPWQNGHVERLIGSVRREILDHVVVLGERHLRDLLANYSAYYNDVRTHLALGKDAPRHRPAQTVGRIASVSWLGGLHNQYVRMA